MSPALNLCLCDWQTSMLKELLYPAPMKSTEQQGKPTCSMYHRVSLWHFILVRSNIIFFFLPQNCANLISYSPEPFLCRANLEFQHNSFQFWNSERGCTEPPTWLQKGVPQRSPVFCSVLGVVLPDPSWSLQGVFVLASPVSWVWDLGSTQQEHLETTWM